MLPDKENHYDNFDGKDRYKSLSGMRSGLFSYFSFEEFGVDSFDLAASTMSNLTEDGGVKKLVLREGPAGSSSVPAVGSIWMHFVTFAEGISQPIDSTRSYDFIRPHKVGVGKLLLGVEMGIQTMRVGEISKYILQPEYAYGKLGCPDVIAPNCRILMVIEIMQAVAGPLKKPIYNLTTYQRSCMSFKEIYEGADELRLAGNKKFKFQLYYDAIERYEKAIEMLEEIKVISEKDSVTRSELQYNLFSNIAICYLRVDDPAQAIVACEAALMPGMPEPTSAKIFYRFAEASFLLQKLDDADKYLAKAMEFDPRNIDFLLFQEQIRYHIKKEEGELSKMYKRMFK